MKDKCEDLFFMKKAFKLAEKAGTIGEVPVGALIVRENEIIAEAFNQKELSQKATAHAEIFAIEQASLKLNTWRLNDCTLYVTLEPCPMCAGAIVATRLKRLVYACKDSKAGAVHSLYQITEDSRLNHRVEIHQGILAKESSKLLKSFFRKKRFPFSRD